jgi:hypothetical protein
MRAETMTINIDFEISAQNELPDQEPTARRLVALRKHGYFLRDKKIVVSV